jgi:serine phosphatase RsbU (regulator of sigma subunit)
MKKVLFFIILLISYSSIAQRRDFLDSLQVEVSQSKNLEDRVRNLLKIAFEYRVSSPDSSLLFASKAQAICPQDTTNALFIYAIHGKAQALSRNSKQAEAELLIGITSRFYMRNDDKFNYAYSLASWAIIDKYNNKLNAGIEKLIEAALIYESDQVNHLDDLADCYGTLGQLFNSKNELESALSYTQKEVEIVNLIGNEADIGHSLTNLGVIYGSLDSTEKAIECYEKSNFYKRKLGDSLGVAINYSNVANHYADIGNKKKALWVLEEAIRIATEVDSKLWIGIIEVNLADFFLRKKDYSTALVHLNTSLAISLEVDYEELTVACYSGLTEAFEGLGNYKEALVYSNLKSQLETEMYKKNSSARIEEMKAKYESEKKDKEITELNGIQKIKDAELAKNKAEAERNKFQKYMLFGGLSLVIIFSLVVLKRFRITRKQNVIIEGQKEKVDLAYMQLEEKSREILDSINYAKRIQNAILPPQKLVKEKLPVSFVLYKPKDIVAGDFYWMEPISDGVLFAAADCTGHGVPGAMVSVICNNGLNRSVREYGLNDPGEILDKTREIVIQEFEKSEEEVKDGMDIAICSLSYDSSLEHANLTYAGAHNPLWIIRNGGTKIEEIKADKQPIGQFAKAKPFTSHGLKLYEGDTLYIFSDGIADQFGGKKGKKFKTTSFKSLLVSICHESMERQKELIDSTFEEWKGSLDQLDDVCMIGVRI